MSQLAADLQAQAKRRTPVVEVFEATRQAVVNISSTQIIQEVYSPSGFDRLFDQLFALPRHPMRQYRLKSVGSGFILHRDGYVVTNYHVVARTAERKVIFADKQEYDAEVIATDAQRDLAVLKIQIAQPLEPLKLGRSKDLMVGETVIAIGNPLGYQHTVTAGVVSALNRSIPASEGVEFKGLIQTDASINPGNSGGPLLNVLGELVGINTAIRTDAQNIGFAIPVDHLREVLPEMLAIERRYRFVVGLTLAKGHVASITSVEPGSPAAEAGIRVADQVMEVDGQSVGSAIDYHIAMIGRAAGQMVTLTVLRQQASRQIDLTLAMPPRPDGVKLLQSRLGIKAVQVTRSMASRLGLPRLQGLMIQNVESPSPASALRLRRGNVILELGRHQVATFDDAGELLQHVEPGTPVMVGILQVRRDVLVRRRAILTAR